MSLGEDLFKTYQLDTETSTKHLLVLASSLLYILLEKEIITVEDFRKARARATSEVDQVWARRKEEVDKEFDEKHPGVRKFWNTLFGGE
jgi:hypothetical protein